ncbi:transcriptional regulator [Listeria floridensis FSL S10-1187]|uniref:Transcriptional regulator n=1 Tax=Listeria floridensis FSL S10-1187 TaxID=1265817 RepID=A0ABP3AV14_9LIST|nr:transcriptional regulator [Listeria floridensis FSL S10-1187]
MPGIDKIQRVADYFGVSVDYLLGRDHRYVLEEDEAAFQAFINDPELYVWYKELPTREEELQDLRELWELMKKTRNK